MNVMPLVGRAPEVAAVRTAVEAVSSGSGGLLLVTGEAGVGKSRLLTEAAQVARDRGVRVLTGRGAEDGDAYRPISDALLRGGAGDLDPADLPGLRPYHAALARLLPAWAGSGLGGPEQAVDPVLVLAEGLIRLLRELVGAAACLIVLDDVHWADADTLALLEYLAERLRDLPLLVLASARDDEPGSVVVDRLTAVRAARVLPLSRLDRADLTALAQARSAGRWSAEALTRVVERADGLPLLVEELLQDAVRDNGPIATVPRTMTALVRRRLSRLTPGHRDVLAGAAMTGTDPDWEVLPAVVATDSDTVLAAARAATRACLLRDDGDALRWRHAVIREAVLSGLLPPERASLALAVAGALLTRGRREDLTRAADLLAAGGDRARAVALFVDLARDDRTSGALRRAERLLDRADDAGAGPATTAVERVAVLTMIGRVSEAIDVGVAALPFVTGEVHAELCLRLARTAVIGRRWAAAQAYVERAGRPDDPRSLLLAADAAFGAGDVERAGRLSAMAVDRAVPAGPPEVLCEALDIAGRAARLHDPGAARLAFGRAAQVAAEHRLVAQHVAALLGLGTVELLEGECSPALRTASELATSAGLFGQACAAQVVLLDSTIVADGPRAAEAQSRVLLEQGVRLGLPEVHWAAALGIALARAAAGDLEEMTWALAQVPRTSGPPDAAALVLAVRSLPALLAHDLPAASAQLDAGVARLVAHRSAAPLHQFGLWVLLRTAVEDRGAAARETLRHHPAVLRPANRGALRYADAVAAGREGRAAEAAGLFAAGDADLSPLPWLHRLLRLVVLEAAVLDGWGDPVPLLRHDLGEHVDAGETSLARWCRDLLRRAGAPTRRGRGASRVPAPLRAAGVTSREMDVLSAVSTGASNAEIAARLHLSVRTVETHVANLLGKLGATDRTQLRERAAALTR